MRSKWIAPVAVVAGFLVLAIAYGGCKYNSLVNAEEDVAGAWAQVENVLKRRADLIPNLVETVKGFAAQEKEIFSNVAEARSRLLAARGPEEAADANAGLTSALGRLLMVSERYPELKSNQNFLRLQDELAGTENRIATERKRYNDKVVEYNKTIRRFPSSIFAGMFGFDKKEYFEVQEADKQVPQVKF
jgi:LemA protein